MTERFKKLAMEDRIRVHLQMDDTTQAPLKGLIIDKGIELKIPTRYLVAYTDLYITELQFIDDDEKLSERIIKDLHELKYISEN